MLVFAAIPALAQPTIQQRIQDSVIGWKTIYSFKGKQYKTAGGGWANFSPYQQSLRDTFISWMQKTYKPVGGFGHPLSKDFTTAKKQRTRCHNVLEWMR